MALRIPARNVAGDQIMESVTNANSREEQVVRIGGTFPIPATTGTITTATSTVTVADISNAGTCLVMIYGTYAGVNLSFEALDSAGGNTTWIPIAGAKVDSPGDIRTTTGVLPANSVIAFRFPVARMSSFRVRATAWTSGTANVIIDPAAPFGEPIVSAVDTSLPPGASRVTIYGEALAYTAATEALLSLTKQVEGAAVVAAGANNITPTAGRTLVLQALNITYITPGTAPSAAVTERFRGRYGVGANPSITSPIQALNIRFPIPATANASGTLSRSWGLGFVIPSGNILGIGALGSAAAPTNPPTFDVEIVGYEY